MNRKKEILWSEKERLYNATDQFDRYGSVDKDIVDIIERLTDINDDRAHGRCKEGLKKSADAIKVILDNLTL